MHSIFLHLLLLLPLLRWGTLLQQLLFWALVFFLLRARASYIASAADKGSGVKLTHSWKQGATSAGPRSREAFPTTSRRFALDTKPAFVSERVHST
jgi:hypothetical protein